MRRDFHDTVCSLYRESFLLPQRAYCERYGMAFVGHLHCEDYLHLQIATQGDFTRALAAFSYAGCDRIEYSGEKLTEKLVSSVANQYGQERVLSESFAQGGWGFTYADLRRWTDYQLVRGVNLVVPHAFYYSVRGERKLDCPPSYFLQSPGYPWYHLYAGYAGRLSAVLSGGRPLCHLAVYYPTAAGQVLYDPADREAVRRLDRDVQDIALGLQEALYDYQFINDEALDGLQPQETGFCCGRCVFRALLIPAAPYLPMQAMEAIARLAERGSRWFFSRNGRGAWIRPSRYCSKNGWRRCSRYRMPRMWTITVYTANTPIASIPAACVRPKDLRRLFSRWCGRKAG